jgi:branched-chain amino acid transport system substrate-binding protein
MKKFDYNRAALPAPGRRQVLKGLGLATGGLVAGPTLLAACASSSSSTSAAGTTSASASATAGSGALSNAQLTQQLGELLGPINAAQSGKNLTIPFGVQVSLSGDAIYSGTNLLKGAQLGVEHLALAGGPTFTITAKDDQSVNPTAQAQDARAFGEAHIPISLAQSGDQGGLPLVAQYKILTFDGGGFGAEDYGMPFYWSGLATPILASLPGMAKFIAANFPGKKKIVSVGIGGVGVDVSTDENAIKQAFGSQNLPVPTFIEGPSYTSTEYGPTVSSVVSANPDLILLQLYGPGLGLFMKGLSSYGLKAPVIGVDYEPTSAQIAGSAMIGYMFVQDYFNPINPGNPWGKLFSDSFQAKFGTAPVTFNANAYEEVFVFWNLIRRVLASGGDPTNSTQLQAALVANPTANSVYGPGAKTGTLAWDVTTHALSHRTISIFQVETATAAVSGTGLKALATCDQTGSNYQTLASPST